MKNLDVTIQELQKEKEQLQKIAEHQLSKIRNKAQKLLKAVEKRLDMIREDGEKFKVIITPETGTLDKYSHRIYEVIQQTLGDIVLPDNINHYTLQEYAENTRNALRSQDEILIKYVKLLKDKRYKPRVKALSRSLTKLNSDLEKLENFISGEYVPNADIENRINQIDELLNLISAYQKEFTIIVEKEAKIKEFDEKLSELRQEINKWENHEAKLKYQKAVENYKKLQKELNDNMSNIRKALRKYANTVSKGKNKKDVSLIKELVSDPMECLAKQQSVNIVSNLFNEINSLLDDAALKLKKDKREAAKSDIKKMLDGDLNRTWQNSRKTKEELDKTKSKLDDLNIEKQIEKLKSNLNGMIRDRNRVIERELRKIGEIQDSIEKIYSEFIQNIDKYDIDQPSESIILDELPKWANLIE